VGASASHNPIGLPWPVTGIAKKLTRHNRSNQYFYKKVGIPCVTKYGTQGYDLMQTTYS
jgi:hypothetical protein